MGRICTICVNPERQAIDRALVDGGSKRAIASQFRVTRASVQRHAARHVPKQLAEAARAEAACDATSLLEHVRGMLDKAQGALDRAEAAKDDRLGAVWFREARATLELLGRVSGELAAQNSVTVQVGIWQRLGVRDEDEALRRLEASREVEALDEHQLAERAVAGLAWYSKQYPDRAESIRCALFEPQS